MLEYVALGSLVFMALSLLFGAIVIVDIPYRIAVERNHPHKDAIRHAGWVSLFTLHSIWPLVWVWASACSEDQGPRFSRMEDNTAINDRSEPQFVGNVADEDITDSVTLLGHKYEVLDDRIDRIEKAIMAAGEAA